MNEAAYIAILTEERFTRFEAERMWNGDKFLREKYGEPDATSLRAFAREALPSVLRLRALQKARGARPDPDL
jgi:hypothetical protein